MTKLEYLVGLAFFAGTVGSVSLAATLMVRRFLAHLAGAPRLVAFAILVTFGVLLSHLLPGVCGVLDRATALGTAAGLAGLALAVARRREAPAAPDVLDPQPAPSGTVSWLFAGAAAAVVAVAQLGYFNDHLEAAPMGVDALNFHLPHIAEWIQSGSLWGAGHFTPGQATGSYPSNGNVVLLASMLPWRSDFLVRPTLLPYLMLTAVAVYALAVELGAVRATAVAFGALTVTIPAISVNALDATLPDVVLTSTFGGGLLFLARHARTGARSDLVLAGLGLGLAFGTKWFGVSSVIAVLAVWTVAALLGGRRRSHVAREVALLAGLVGLAGGFWLLRNIVETGNPLFSLGLSALGLTLLEAPPNDVGDLVGLSIADYLDRPGALSDYVWPGWKVWLAAPGVLIGLGVGVVALRLSRAGLRARPEDLVDARLATALAGIVVLLGVYAVTPYSAFGPDGRPVLSFVTVRYLDPAIVLAAAVAASGALFLGRARPVVEALAILAALHGLDRGNIGAGWSDPNVFTLALVAGLIGVGATVALGPDRLQLKARLAGGFRSRAALTAATGAAIGCVALVGFGARTSEQRFAATRYSGGDEAIAWITANVPRGARVGVTGFWSTDGPSPVYPSFGPRLRNKVGYVGPIQHDLLQTYRRAHPFVKALRRERWDLLIVGRQRELFEDTWPTRPYAAWATHAGFHLAVESERLVVLQAPWSRVLSDTATPFAPKLVDGGGAEAH